jgi:hypothetical protein
VIGCIVMPKRSRNSSKQERGRSAQVTRKSRRCPIQSTGVSKRQRRHEDATKMRERLQDIPKGRMCAEV